MDLPTSPGPAQTHSAWGQDRAAGQLGPSLAPQPNPTQGLSTAGRGTWMGINTDNQTHTASCLVSPLSFPSLPPSHHRSSLPSHCPPKKTQHHSDPTSFQAHPLFALILHPRCSAGSITITHFFFRSSVISGTACKQTNTSAMVAHALPLTPPPPNSPSAAPNPHNYTPHPPTPHAQHTTPGAVGHPSSQHSPLLSC